jgi:hypothetical protein
MVRLRSTVPRSLTAVLAAGVLAVAVSSSTLEAVAATSGDPAAALVQQIPAGLRKSCQPVGQAAQPAGTDAAVACTPRRAGATRVLFLSLADQSAASARYRHDGDKHMIPRDTNSDCFGYIDAESPFRTKDGTVGRVFCAHRDHSIEWTYSNVVARATGTNDNDLYIWWAHLVGRTLNPTQQALFDQAPAGVDRSNCQDNGDASIKCTSPAANVYVAKYTHYQTPDAMMTAYSSALSAVNLTLNVSPPRAAKNSCGFETTWGPTSPGASALGRAACFHNPKPDGTYHFVWTIVGQLTLVEVYGPSLSDVTQFFKAFSVANQSTRPHLG